MSQIFRGMLNQELFQLTLFLDAFQCPLCAVEKTALYLIFFLFIMPMETNGTNE